jgi:hypothetical protein
MNWSIIPLPVRIQSLLRVEKHSAQVALPPYNFISVGSVTRYITRVSYLVFFANTNLKFLYNIIHEGIVRRIPVDGRDSLAGFLFASLTKEVATKNSS